MSVADELDEVSLDSLPVVVVVLVVSGFVEALSAVDVSVVEVDCVSQTNFEPDLRSCHPNLSKDRLAA